MRNFRAHVCCIAACCSVALVSPAVAGTGYGIYDARTLGMGGVSVASANNDNAQFYNAALLAFNDDHEENTQDARFLFPVIVPQVSQSTIDFEEIANNDLSQSISTSISNFNAMPDALTAQAVVDASRNLDASLAALDGNDVFADMYFGMGLTEPGKFQGAGFFLGVRLLAGGQSTITDADRAILAAYQEGLSFVASAGNQGVAHPELFDANGALLNPNSQFDSTASAAGAAITEIGVAMSSQFHWFGQPLAAGISFKVLDIDTFEDAERVIEGRVDVDRNSETDTNINFDVGLVREIGERWRVALAIKDIVPHNYKTSLGTIVRLRPRSRIGVSYQSGSLQVAADADLIQSQPLGDEQAIQEFAVGGEWSFDFPLKVRAGYRHDIKSVRKGMISAGVGTQWKRLVVDAGYAEGNDSRAAALQFGVAF